MCDFFKTLLIHIQILYIEITCAQDRFSFFIGKKSITDRLSHKKQVSLSLLSKDCIKKCA
jgi:hypothetical protein